MAGNVYLDEDGLNHLIDLLSEQLEGYVKLTDLGSSPIKTTVTGQTITVSDVSPFKHDLAVQVERANSYVTGTPTEISYNGQPYPVESDGSVTGLVSTSPNLEMSVPDGFVINLTYYKDPSSELL